MLYASDPNWSGGTGQLWRIGMDHRSVLLAQGLGTTNGIEASPDEWMPCVNETVQRSIWAYDLLPDGDIGIDNRRLLTSLNDQGLDGMRCDVPQAIFTSPAGRRSCAQTFSVR